MRNIKKRKVKIPAANKGMGFSYQDFLNSKTPATNKIFQQPTSQLPDYSQKLKQQADVNNMSNLAKLNALNLTKVDISGTSAGRPTGNAAIDKAGAIGESIAAGVAGTMDQFMNKSTATNTKEAVTQSVSDVLNRTSQGYNIGKNFGSIGAAVGAGVGAAVGLVGRSGQKAKMTSFTDYDEGTLGTGLIGAFGNRKLRRERNRMRQNAYGNRDAVRGTDYLQNEWLLEHGGMDVDTFAEGGIIPSSLVYVDDGELINTPDGSTLEVPEKGRPTDSNLVDLPVGSKILSDSLKVPGTKKTFAQVGKEMMTKNKSKGKDRYAENSRMLNDRNNQAIQDQLFEIQEAVKKQKGIKPKYKDTVIPAASNGDGVTGYNTYSYKIHPDIAKWNPEYYKDGKYTPKYLKAADFLGTERKTVKMKDINGNDVDVKVGMSDLAYNYFVDKIKKELGDKYIKELYTTNKSPLKQKYHKAGATDEKVSTLHQITGGMAELYERGLKPLTTPKLSFNPGPSELPVPEVLGGGTMTYDPKKLKGTPTITESAKTLKTPKTFVKERNGINWGNIADYAMLLPYLERATPEFGRPHYNPYATAITNTMGNRRYDISNEIQDIIQNRAISNRNISQMNTNTGASLAYALNSAVQANKSIAAAHRYKHNVDAQYAGEYAQMMNNLGQQWVAEENRVQQMNRAAKGAADTINMQQRENFITGLQNIKRQHNLAKRDRFMWPAYQKFLEAGMTNEEIMQMLNQKYLG